MYHTLDVEWISPKNMPLAKVFIVVPLELRDEGAYPNSHWLSSLP